MKKSVKILAGITAFVLIGGILWFASGILGNPISKVLANNTCLVYTSIGTRTNWKTSYKIFCASHYRDVS